MLLEYLGSLITVPNLWLSLEDMNMTRIMESGSSTQEAVEETCVEIKGQKGFPVRVVSDESGDRPRPLLAITELKNATDVTQRRVLHLWIMMRRKLVGCAK